MLALGACGGPSATSKGRSKFQNSPSEVLAQMLSPASQSGVDAQMVQEARALLAAGATLQQGQLEWFFTKTNHSGEYGKALSSPSSSEFQFALIVLEAASADLNTVVPWSGITRVTAGD